MTDGLSVIVGLVKDLDEQALLIQSGSGATGKRRAPARRANDLDGRSWLRNSIGIWSDLSKTSEESSLGHPAMFPASLVLRLLESFTRHGPGVVLDPFSGMGSTVLAAESVGKLGIGLDISREYIARSNGRPSLPAGMFDRIPDGAGEDGERRSLGERLFILADARDILDHVESESVDMVITSPPYWDILLRSRSADQKKVRNYGDLESDLGRISGYEEFLLALDGVFAGVLKVLKAGCYCCVIVMDLRKRDHFFPLHSDLAVLMQELGYLYDDLIIWDRRSQYNNLRPLGHPSVFRVNRVHEYILIFQKPRSS